MRSIPLERRLVLKTHLRSRLHDQLAHFLQVPVQTLDAGRGHVNRSTYLGSLDSLADQRFLDGIVDTICRENMARHCPEVTGARSVQALWRDAIV